MADLELTDDEVDRRDFMEAVRELLGRPGITLDQVRHAIATQTPAAPYFTLADADQMVLKIQRALVNDDSVEADNILHALHYKIVKCLARSESPAQLAWFRALAKKAEQADELIDKFEEASEHARAQRQTDWDGPATGTPDRSSAEPSG